MKKTILFDIDGTVADLRHRLHFVSNGRRDWSNFFANLHLDTPIEQTVWLNHVLSERDDVSIIFASGRGEEYRAATEAWLNENNLVRERLYMRAAGDYRPDHVVKIELLAEMRADGYEPFLVIDDRPQVIKAWRAAGLFVLACPHEGEERQPHHWSHKFPLTVMVGPSGSGKSTIAAKLPGTISSDQLRLELFGDMRIQANGDRVFDAMRALASERLRLGLPVVLDATHLKRRDRLAAVKIAPEDMPVLYYVVNRPMSEKMRDGGYRNEVLTRGDIPLMQKHEQTFRSNLKDILRGDDLPNVTVLNAIQE